MYYSITFKNSSNVSKNTWDDWHLIPSSPPMIEPPEVYTNYVDIPGRTAGAIDLSEVLTGGPVYQDSEGSWEFIMEEGFYSRAELYEILKKFLHGRNMKIYLEEDPAHYYYGRITVGMPSTSNTNPTFTLDYHVRPVRYKLNGTADGI